MFDRLMRWAVFAETDGIVRHDEDRRSFHQGCKPHAGAHVVREVKEGGAEGTRQRQRNSVGRCCHGMFAYTEVNVASGPVLGTEVTGVFGGQVYFVGLRQIGRAADHPWHILCDGVLNLAGTFAAGDALCIRREGGQALVPPLGELTLLH